MIINCINCNKRFEVNSYLIPDKGRTLRCGSCNHTWFFTPEFNNVTKKSINDEPEQNIANIQKNISINIGDNIDEKNKNNKELNNNNIHKKSKNSIFNNFFSYLIVFFISFVALIIFIDTIKIPLINIIPNFEIILFNLFETLKDIKLFIIDLL